MRIFLVLGSLFLYALCLYADVKTDLKIANTLYEQKKYAEALAMFKSLADQNDTRARGMIGIMYETGHGVPQDHNKALEWYAKACEDKTGLAEALIGMSYSGWYDSQENKDEATKWFKKKCSKRS